MNINFMFKKMIKILKILLELDRILRLYHPIPQTII